MHVMQLACIYRMDFQSNSLDETYDENDENESDEDSELQNDPSRQRKYIVFESALLPLFKHCRSCGLPVTLSTSMCGTLLVIKGSCPDGHIVNWQSQPLIGRTPAGNLLLAGAILFSGSTYTKLETIANLLNLAIFSERTFYRIQEARLFPLVNSYYKDNQIVIAEMLRDSGPLIVFGDGCCDSPGYCAKYCTYSLMDNSSGLIIDYSLVQVTDTGTSGTMEREGLRRCLTKVLSEFNLNLGTLATDRHRQISAVMRADYPNIIHQYDVWHVSKSVTKKLTKEGIKNGHSSLLPWIQSISNHLWWSAKTCNSNPDVLVAKWSSIVHHIVNVHTWQDDHFSSCQHESLDNAQRRTKWLKPNGRAHLALQKVVLKETLLRDIAKLSSFCHTGMLEVFHSLLTKYCPKRQHFSFMGMSIRTELSHIGSQLQC